MFDWFTALVWRVMYVLGNWMMVGGLLLAGVLVMTAYCRCVECAVERGESDEDHL